MENVAEKKAFQWGVGRRKTSIARVRLYKNGVGDITINGKTLDAFFKTEQGRLDVLSPLRESHLEGKVDIKINVSGGGITGQSQAIRMGIARAISKQDPDLTLPLRKKGFLTRDARAVERKKYGHPKARKSWQFSKR